MRKLCLRDTVDVVKICKKAHLEETFKSLFKSGKTADQEEIGIDAFISVVCACAEENIETEIYALIGRIAEVSAEEIATMPLEDLWNGVIIEIAKNNNLYNFFSNAVKSMN